MHRRVGDAEEEDVSSENLSPGGHPSDFRDLSTFFVAPTFLSIEALRLLPVHDMAFTAQEHVQTPIAEPPLLGSQFAQAKT